MKESSGGTGGSLSFFVFSFFSFRVIGKESEKMKLLFYDLGSGWQCIKRRKERSLKKKMEAPCRRKVLSVCVCVCVLCVVLCPCFHIRKLKEIWVLFLLALN